MSGKWTCGSHGCGRRNRNAEGLSKVKFKCDPCAASCLPSRTQHCTDPVPLSPEPARATTLWATVSPDHETVKVEAAVSARSCPGGRGRTISHTTAASKEHEVTDTEKVKMLNDLLSPFPSSHSPPSDRTRRRGINLCFHKPLRCIPAPVGVTESSAIINAHLSSIVSGNV